jgi:hypothetical protein
MQHPALFVSVNDFRGLRRAHKTILNCVIAMAIINMLGGAILFATVVVIGVRITLLIFQKKPGNLPPGPKGRK